VGAAEADHPAGANWRSTAQDRHADGDERHPMTGCPWSYLPRESFPPRSTVYNIFRNFQRDGVWEAIWAELHMALREQMGREASPSAAVLDSQSVKSAEKGAVKTIKVGYDAAKRVKGRKIHALVDSEGAVRCGSSFIPLRSRTATAPVASSARYASCRGWN
jgi:hypothetical protein